MCKDLQDQNTGQGYGERDKEDGDVDSSSNIHLALFWLVISTEGLTDLDQRRLFLTTLELSSIFFEKAGTVVKIGSCHESNHHKQI